MILSEFIRGTLNKNITESASQPFRLTKASTGIHQYDFTVSNIDYECIIYKNQWKQYTYDVVFTIKNGNVKHRLGKDLEHMNSVLKTVADCMIDFIHKIDKIKIIEFDGDELRLPAYIRFFRRHPYFSKFEIDDTFTRSGYVEIRINKGFDEND